MHKRSPEEQNIARFHENRTGFLALGQGNGHIGEADSGVCLRRAEDRPSMTPRNHLHAAIGLVARIQRQPRRQTGPWMGFEEILVLVQGLSA